MRSFEDFVQVVLTNSQSKFETILTSVKKVMTSSSPKVRSSMLVWKWQFENSRFAGLYSRSRSFEKPKDVGGYHTPWLRYEQLKNTFCGQTAVNRFSQNLWGGVRRPFSMFIILPPYESYPKMRKICLPEKKLQHDLWRCHRASVRIKGVWELL